MLRIVLVVYAIGWLVGCATPQDVQHVSFRVNEVISQLTTLRNSHKELESKYERQVAKGSRDLQQTRDQLTENEKKQSMLIVRLGDLEKQGNLNAEQIALVQQLVQKMERENEKAMKRNQDAIRELNFRWINIRPKKQSNSGEKNDE